MGPQGVFSRFGTIPEFSHFSSAHICFYIIFHHLNFFFNQILSFQRCTSFHGSPSLHFRRRLARRSFFVFHSGRWADPIKSGLVGAFVFEGDRPRETLLTFSLTFHTRRLQGTADAKTTSN